MHTGLQSTTSSLSERISGMEIRVNDLEIENADQADDIENNADSKP